MANYTYTKSPVDIDTLTEDILSSDISSATFSYSTFNAPNNLSLFFVGDLSVPDKTTLDGIVTAHTGIPEYTESGYIAVADGEGGMVFIIPETVASGIAISENIDGGSAISTYGGVVNIDGGDASSF